MYPAKRTVGAIISDYRRRQNKMSWTSEVPRHLNRGLLVSAIIHYSTKISTVALFAIGPLVASVTILIVLFPLLLTLLLCSKSIGWIKQLAIRRRYPHDTLVNNSNQSHMPSLDEFHNNYVAILTTMRGILYEQEIIRRLYNQFVDKNNKSSGTDGYSMVQSHLKCNLSTRYGLPVWTPDTNFDIRNHVISIGDRYNGQPITMKNMKTTIGNLCARLPNSSRPPWEIFLLHVQSPSSRKPDLTAMLIRVHHIIATNWITPIINLFDQSHASGSFRLFKITMNPIQSYCRPIFSRDSATSEVARKVFNSTILTIDRYRSKCDPNVPNVDASGDPLWISVRGTIKILRNVNDKLQKLSDTCTELGTSSNTRVSWSRSPTLVNLAPRLLWLVQDRLWEIKISGLVRHVLTFTITQLPDWSLRILHSVVQKFIRASLLVVIELKNYKTYKILLLKRCLKEFHLTFKAIILAPFFIFLHWVSTRSESSKIRTKLLANPTMAWSEPLSLNTVRKVAESTECSVFQVLASAASGALVQYFKENNQMSSHVQISIPVYSSRNNGIIEGYFKLEIPILGTIGRHQRLKMIKDMMINSSTEFQYFLSIMYHRYLARHIPSYIRSYFSCTIPNQPFFKLFNVVVPYNEYPPAIDGKVIDSFYCWNSNKVPTMNLMTFSDQVTLIVTGNSTNLPRPDIIANLFVREFESLAWLIENKKD